MAGLVILIVFVLMALLAPLLVSSTGLDVTKATGPPLEAPSWAYPLGTDNQGRSVLTLIIWGSRISLMIGLLAALVSMVVGAILGIVAGYRGGWIDTALMRLTDWFLVLPWIALMIVLAAILGQSFDDHRARDRLDVVGLDGPARPESDPVDPRASLRRTRPRARLQRRSHHDASRPSQRDARDHRPDDPVGRPRDLGRVHLSFIGLGDPLRVSWGQTLEQAFETGAVTLGAWWWIGAPGVCIVLLVLAFTMCSTALEEIFNPRLRQR